MTLAEGIEDIIIKVNGYNNSEYLAKQIASNLVLDEEKVKKVLKERGWDNFIGIDALWVDLSQADLIKVRG